MRNFGIHRNLFGAELSRYWHDNEFEPRWPYVAIGVAVVIIIAVGMFA